MTTLNETTFKNQLLSLVIRQKTETKIIGALIAILFLLVPIGIATPIIFLLGFVTLFFYAEQKKDEIKLGGIKEKEAINVEVMEKGKTIYG
jgi:hypothetical protein